MWFESGVVTYDDVSFGPAYSGNGPLTLIGAAMGFYPPAVTQQEHLYTRVSFYPNHDATASPHPYTGTPVVWVLDWGWWSGSSLPFPYFPEPVTFNSTVMLHSGNVFSDGPQDRTCGVKVELFFDAALTVYANEWQVMRRGNLPADGASSMPLRTGTSDFFGWYSPRSGVTHGDIGTSQRTGGTPASNRATYLAFQGAGLCGTADFDGDGDLGTDADIEAFFACLAGNCCPTCSPGGADFNADGDSGTDADIESFFRVLAGGPC
jgi:hypothetical protein